MSDVREPDGRQAVSRRRVLRAVTPAVATLLAGCGFQPFDEPGPVPAGQLFIENRTNFSKLIALTVSVQGQDDGPLINQEYRIPEWHALEFDGVLETQRTYDIRAYQPNARGRGREQLVLSIDPCDQNDASGEMDVTILASSNGPDILTYDCDEVYAKTQSLTYADPAQYETQTITSTIAPPTDS